MGLRRGVPDIETGEEEIRAEESESEEGVS